MYSKTLLFLSYYNEAGNHLHMPFHFTVATVFNSRDEGATENMNLPTHLRRFNETIKTDIIEMYNYSTILL